MKKRLISLILIMVLLMTSLPVFATEETVDVDLMNEIINLIENYHHYDVSREEIITGAYKGMLSVLDKHSTYFTSQEYKDFMNSLNGEFIGIGVYIEAYEKWIKVISPIEGMPAFNAGIKSGDIITHVDDFDISQVTFEKGIDMILGDIDTDVKITIKRDGEILSFIIKRKLILVPDVSYELLDNNIGYLKIIQFGDDVSGEVDTAITDLKKQGMTSIIVDLRNNPGGFLDEVVKVADWFIEPNDDILHVDSKVFKDEDYFANKAALNIPTMVLINKGTASASEILAGAIKNNKEGTIIGETSYGKGTVQNIIGLSDGSAIKLTIAEYLSANEIPVNNIGITPDLIVEEKNQADLDAIKAFVPMISDTLEFSGKKGIDTYGAQQRLKFLGYDVDVTGIFEAKTFRALEKFQQLNKLKQLHAIYPETKEALDQAINQYMSDDPQLDKAIETILSK